MAKAASEVEELPKAIVRRVVKDKLTGPSNQDEINATKMLSSLSESARIFVHCDRRREEKSCRRLSCAELRRINSLVRPIKTKSMSTKMLSLICPRAPGSSFTTSLLYD
ncbi:PREDICTED: uncharacterized protein LOC104591060 isoform X2 [Nelumbo nucifera]|uniref:Uncharacterized protein LOC104591060 isoform X2 n=1 Tax=Nelumbo nucifera TaxID=4432 RepID=A0A1U7Z6Y6_NELNU|nr:PREDICTED: uncharacterized protein LOC104591060 isoform X2 [Nelumbo nucifera]